MSSHAWPGSINYIWLYGYNSITAASVFATAYTPLLIWFLGKSFRQPTYVYYVLSFFCSIRVVDFVIRAIQAGGDAGQNLSLSIADQVFNVGYIGLLYPAYSLVLDRELIVNRPLPQSPVLRVTRNRALIRLALLVAVILGLAGASIIKRSSGLSSSTATLLCKASLMIFLVLTVFQVFQTVMLAQSEISGDRTKERPSNLVGEKHGILILLVISLCLFVREGFMVATINAPLKRNKDALWYPLLALPEILAVVLYSVPGLVPPRLDLPGSAGGESERARAVPAADGGDLGGVVCQCRRNGSADDL